MFSHSDAQLPRAQGGIQMPGGATDLHEGVFVVALGRDVVLELSNCCLRQSTFILRMRVKDVETSVRVGEVDGMHVVFSIWWFWDRTLKNVRSCVMSQVARTQCW